MEERVPVLDLIHSLKQNGPLFACMTCQRYDVPKDHACDDTHDASGRRIERGHGARANGPFGEVTPAEVLEPYDCFKCGETHYARQPIYDLHREHARQAG